MLPFPPRDPRYALISVSDKTGIVEFASGLIQGGYTILSTGGTAKALRNAGLDVTDVSQITGFPEMMDGRLKTLHPNVHGGLLARRNEPDDLEAIANQGIELIDLLCVNLYPFEDTIAKPDCTLDDATENIDIGGPAMVRSAAKSGLKGDVIVVCDPNDYSKVLAMSGSPERQLAFKQYLAAKAYTHTAAYDATIAAYLVPLFPDPMQ